MDMIQIAYTVNEDSIASGFGKFSAADAERDINSAEGVEFVEWIDEDDFVAHVNVSEDIVAILEEDGVIEIHTRHGVIDGEMA